MPLLPEYVNLVPNIFTFCDSKALLSSRGGSRSHRLIHLVCATCSIRVVRTALCEYGLCIGSNTAFRFHMSTLLVLYSCSFLLPVDRFFGYVWGLCKVCGESLTVWLGFMLQGNRALPWPRCPCPSPPQCLHCCRAPIPPLPPPPPPPLPPPPPPLPPPPPPPLRSPTLLPCR